MAERRDQVVAKLADLVSIAGAAGVLDREVAFGERREGRDRL